MGNKSRHSGRKTDVKDAEWIVELLQHGLLKEGYIPSREQQELQELVCYRSTLVEAASLRVQKPIYLPSTNVSPLAEDPTGPPWL